MRTRSPGSPAPEPARRAKWRRWVARAAILVVLLALAIPLAVVGSLHLRSVRAALADWASGKLEARAGIAVRVTDFELDWLRGVVDIRDLELARTGATDRPFFTVPLAQVDLDPRALVRGHLVVFELKLDRPRVALDAPLPSRPSGKADGQAAQNFDYEIRSFEIQGGTIESGSVPPSAGAWVSGWSLADLTARGSLARGRGELSVSRARLRAERLAQAPIEVDIEGAAALAEDGTLTVQSVKASGAGIALAAHGAVQLAPQFAFDAAYDVRCDFARLVPDLLSRGSLTATGTVAMGRGGSLGPTGSARIEVLGVPADLAAPWIDVQLPPALALAGTDLDGTADLQFDFSTTKSLVDFQPDAVRGAASLLWRRGATHLLEASLVSDATTPMLPDRSAPLSIQAALLPDAAGERRAEGTVQIKSWRDLASAELLTAHVHVREPEIGVALDRFALHLPWAGGTPPGEVEGTLEAVGPLLAPRLRLDATWRDAGETLATIAARTPLRSHGWNGSASPVDFELALLPELPGTVEARGRLASLALADTIVRVDVPDLGAALADISRRTGIALPAGDPPLVESLQGRFDGEAQVSGPLTGLRATAHATWSPTPEGSVEVTAAGTLMDHSPFFHLEREATFVARNVDATRFGAPGLVIHSLEAASDGALVDVRDLRASLPSLAEGGPRGELEGHGRFDLAWPPRTADAELAVEHSVEGIERATAHLRLENGVLHVDPLAVRSGEANAIARAEIPLAALAPTAGPLHDLLAGYASGPLRLEAEGIDLAALARYLALPDEAPLPSGTLDATLTLVADDLFSSRGSLTIRDLAVDLEGRRLEGEDPVRIELRDGRVVLPTTRLRATGPAAPEGARAEISGSIDLARDWQPGQELASMVSDFSVELHGVLEAAVLARLLGSGTAAGNLQVDASVRGPLGSVTADLRASGPDARLSFFSPYATKLEAPDAHLVVRDGTVAIESARARWNGGTFELEGTVKPGGESELHAKFGGVTYRFDYGVTTRIGGRLALKRPAEGRARLEGDVVVERATLRRNVTLDRELLRSVLEPESLADDPLLDTLDLGLTITTDLGLVIKNNVADVHADWTRLEVTGTAAAPKLTGRVVVDPGGLLNLLGSILRIDEATLTWSGDPPGSPRIAMRTTSSIDDPTIKNQWYRSWYGTPILGPGQGGSLDLTAARGSSTELMDAFTAGVMSYSQDRVAGALSGGAAQTEFSYQPLALYGETDTTARMTVTQRLSAYTTFIASTSATDAEAQTYILDVHALDFAPGLTAQIFTNDDKHEGMTLQQTLRLGRAPPDAQAARRLRKVRIEAPDGISKRKLKRAISYRTGDHLPDGVRLDVELDVLEALRRLGYPQSDVTVDEQPATRQRLDLRVTVVPGQQTRSEFTGDRPRASARRAIAALYRVGDEEASSLEEVRRATIRALRDRGFLSPSVTVAVEPEGKGQERTPLTLRVRAEGGRKVDPEPPEFPGVPAQDAATLTAIFPTRLARINLAAAEPAADVRVVRALAAAGYPHASVVSRELSEDGKNLVVRVDPGDQQCLVSVRVEGLAPEVSGQIEPLLDARAGDAARADRVSKSIYTIEKQLRREGHARVEVRTRLEPVAPERPLELALTFDVTAGPVFTIDDVRFEGLDRTNPGWARRVADLSPGAAVDSEALAKARAQLARTGIFREIHVSTEPPTDARSVTETSTTARIPTLVRFDAKERQRWQLSVGGRYESEVGLGAIVDLYNFNSFGRGHTTGVRSIYSQDEKSFRLYHTIPGLFGERSSLDGFAEWKKELVEGVESDQLQAWLQIALPVSKRWLTRVYTLFERRTLTAEDPDPAEPLDQRVISPRLGWQLAYDSRVASRGGLERNRGFFYGFNLVGADSAIGSDLTGLGTFQQWSHFLPLGDRERGRLTWAHSYRVSTINVQDEEVPFDDRLRAGGEYSVRGYPTNSLGPLDADGNALGGEAMFLANEELYVRLGKGVSNLFFFDAGNVWLTLHDVSGRMFKSLGTGLRWSSPVGPLRLDFAWPLDPRPGADTYRIYFGFGNVF